MGAQTCSEDGTHFNSCDCGDLPDGGAGLDATMGGDAPQGNNDGSVLPPTDSGIPDADMGGDASCPPGMTCNTGCTDGGGATVTGTVYDPAGKNPLYGVVVYVPMAPLEPLPKGVPTGADACSCSALFKSGAVTATKTGPDGTFTLNNVPVGSNVPLVLQAGKWRRVVHVAVTACSTNAQPDKSLAFLGTIPAGDTDDNIPDIAVSTGGADTLECLLLRMGIPATEYVAGAGTGTGGHVHVFSGGDPSTLTTNTWGRAQNPPMAGAPPSPSSLWSTADQLMPYDITLLSCEGGETYNANPPALEQYVNAGGRVLASHYHYAWFSGPRVSGQSYAAPTDWGANLATWTGDGGTPATTTAIGGIIDTTVVGSMTLFPKGAALKEWLKDVGALGQNSVATDELSIFSARYDAVVGPSNTPSQPWITSDATGMAGQTMQFSFNAPVPTAANPSPTQCGRVVYSDLHTAGDPTTTDTPPPPAGCMNVNLSAQEKALEFTLFDLSGCVTPDR
jgi:hypothetical protein